MQVELPNDEVVTYTWAPVNKLGEERSVSRDDGVEVQHLLWDNNNVLRETDLLGSVTAEYTYQPEPYGDLVSDRRDSESSFYRFDALGSTTGITNGTGAMTDTYRYSAFGGTTESTGTSETPYKWVGQLGYRQDEAASLYNLRARDYDPTTGQFVSQDPIGLASGDSNFYRYVGNNAVNRRDPSGLDDKAIIDIVDDRYIHIRASQNGLLDGYVASLINGPLATQEATDTLRAARMVNGVAYCSTYTKILVAVRSASVQQTADWDGWFQQNGTPCDLSTGQLIVPRQPAAPPVASSCQTETCSLPKYIPVVVQPSTCEWLMGAKAEEVRIYYDQKRGTDWDIQRLALETATKKLQNIKSLEGLHKNLSDGIVALDYVVRETFSAADTGESVVCYANDPLNAGKAGNVALSALPFVNVRLLSKADDLPSGGGVGRSRDLAPSSPKPPIPQKATDTLKTIEKTKAAPPGYKGGGTFANDGRGGGQILPKTDCNGKPITYQEFDVNPYQKGVNRGAERLVIGSDGKAYFTSDHYQTFTEIQ